jgi:hypothetical protein
MDNNDSENLLDQGSKDLLHNNDSIEGVKTEVTTIQEQEEKSGEKINVPSSEELVARASSSMIVNKKLLNQIITQKDGNKYAISRKAMNRILLAILDLPTDGLPVALKDDKEKLAFGIGQKMIADRFILTQHHISQEMKKRAEQKQKSEENSEDSNPTVGGNDAK